MFDRIEQVITDWPPASRRRLAVHLFVWTLVAAPINVGLYVAGVIDENVLILVTLILSWLALTLTAADLVATTDVREAEESGSESA